MFKKRHAVILTLVCFLAIIGYVFIANHQDKVATGRNVLLQDTVLEYCEIDGAPVWLVYNENLGIVSLQTSSEHLVSHDDSEMKRLTSEAVRLTTTAGPILLGDTGYKFQYRGGFPLWELYRDFEGDESLYLLNFADQARLDKASKTIYAQGDDKYRQEYNQYPSDLVVRIAQVHGSKSP